MCHWHVYNKPLLTYLLTYAHRLFVSFPIQAVDTYKVLGPALPLVSQYCDYTCSLVSPHESRKRHNVGLNVGKEKAKTSAKTTARRWNYTVGIISGTPVTFWRKSGNYCPNLMFLSALWSEIICAQAQTKISHRTLILLLHYVAKTNRSVRNYRTPWLLLYKLLTNSQNWQHLAVIII